MTGINITHEPGKPGHCLKAQVKATLVAANGARYVGTNRVMVPQTVCPRMGMPSFCGYAPCLDVCKQPSHAEVSAIDLAGADAEGATIYLEGHHAPCPDCVDMAAKSGVLAIIVGPPPAI